MSVIIHNTVARAVPFLAAISSFVQPSYRTLGREGRALARDASSMRETSFVQGRLVSSFSFQVSCSTTEFQQSQTNNLKLET